MGPKVAEILLQLFNDGLKTELFHLVGHSLGAQLSGIVARNVISKSNGSTKILRLVCGDNNKFGFFYG